MKSYHAWKEAGSPLNNDGDPIIPNNNVATDIPNATPVNATDSIDVDSTVDMSINGQPSFSGYGKVNDASTPTSANTSAPRFSESDPRFLLKELQNLAPCGMKYCLTLVPIEEETSFEAILKHKKNQVGIKEPPKPKRRINMSGAVVTSKEISDQIIKKAHDEEQKKVGKQQRKEEKTRKLLMK